MNKADMKAVRMSKDPLPMGIEPPTRTYDAPTKKAVRTRRRIEDRAEDLLMIRAIGEVWE